MSFSDYGIGISSIGILNVYQMIVFNADNSFPQGAIGVVAKRSSRHFVVTIDLVPHYFENLIPLEDRSVSFTSSISF